MQHLHVATAAVVRRSACWGVPPPLSVGDLFRSPFQRAVHARTAACVPAPSAAYGAVLRGNARSQFEQLGVAGVANGGELLQRGHELEKEKRGTLHHGWFQQVFKLP